MNTFRRNIPLLAICQALMMSCTSMIIATTSLVGFALATDKSTYDFLISKAERPITVTSELIYRIMFKNWATMKKLDLKDTPLAKNSTEVLEEIVHR